MPCPYIRIKIFPWPVAPTLSRAGWGLPHRGTGIRGTGILPVNHGQDAHATKTHDRMPMPRTIVPPRPTIFTSSGVRV
jgi:hypothetical protein